MKCCLHILLSLHSCISILDTAADVAAGEVIANYLM